MFKAAQLIRLITASLLVDLVACQLIWDVWHTTWNQSDLFKCNKRSPAIEFVDKKALATTNIVIQDFNIFQPVIGFGASLTDSSALLLSNLKTKNLDNYWKLLNRLFTPIEGTNAAGLSYIRVPLGASDFAATRYSFANEDGDTCLNDFNIDNAPPYLFTILKDIQSVNDQLKVHLVPWSPPAWVKTSGTMNAQYLFKCMEGFKGKGIFPYAISVQNEPGHENPTYPTAHFPVSTEAQVGRILRLLMKANGWSGTKLIGYDHNWDKASSNPIQLMKEASDSFDGVAFHCYAGSVAVDQQDAFTNAHPTKEVYFTGQCFFVECSGTIGSDWWSDIKYMDNMCHNARAALMWNLALDSSGNPKLPGTNSCGGSGCGGVVTINKDGTWSLNQEFYAMAQASRAIVPREAGGPSARRIGVEVQGDLNWALRVGAYVTYCANPADPLRYSLVVLNWNDSIGGWNPQPVTSTIEFRGKRATFTFPVGVTTLWWYVKDLRDAPEMEVWAESNGNWTMFQTAD
ncbi:glucan endo-1,6-beta-glucosidase [Coprinopsis sp. MPI-PUGE-AT-0042]|nr:glucan endo-1,6-beta-glucosidase [Coprinopsis sp. MPI-PUGE-AT-0042]